MNTGTENLNDSIPGSSASQKHDENLFLARLRELGEKQSEAIRVIDELLVKNSELSKKSAMLCLLNDTTMQKHDHLEKRISQLLHAQNENNIGELSVIRELDLLIDIHSNIRRLPRGRIVLSDAWKNITAKIAHVFEQHRTEPHNDHGKAAQKPEQRSHPSQETHKTVFSVKWC